MLHTFLTKNHDVLQFQPTHERERAGEMLVALICGVVVTCGCCLYGIFIIVCRPIRLNCQKLTMIGLVGLPLERMR